MSDIPETELSKRMRALAANPPVDLKVSVETLREHADAMDKVTDDFYSTPQRATVKQFVGTWARARRCWCDATGESLI